MSFRSSCSQRSSPGAPGSASLGARLRFERNDAVAATTPSAARDHEPLALAQHLADRVPALVLARGRSGRNGDEEVLAVAAGAVRGAAVLAALGPVLAVIAERKECVLVGDADEHHVTAPSAHSAVRAAAGDVGLPAEARAAVFRRLRPSRRS